MWVQKFEVTGFLGRSTPVEAVFNRDLNILTGRNGSGKTSLLKLMWYIMSGNILLGLQEVEFKRAVLTTSLYRCTVHRISRATCRVEMLFEDGETEYEDIEDDDGDIVSNAEDQAAEVLVEIGRSVFLPTFRRIEGGFTLGGGASRPSLNFLIRPPKKNATEEALEALSRRLSNAGHVFVSAISTGDIVGLLQRHFTNLSDEYNKLQRTMTQEIVETIKHYKSSEEDTTEVETANRLLDSIRSRIENVELSRDHIMRPIGAIQGVVQKLLRHKGIVLGTLNFGDATAAINSEALSAGEKQMLSFIAYNGLNNESVFFIDEPELSLHVDWQRQLFTTLMNQQSTNQFIVATHSPFIYSKYPDKEVVIGSDRGDSEEL